MSDSKKSGSRSRSSKNSRYYDEKGYSSRPGSSHSGSSHSGSSHSGSSGTGSSRSSSSRPSSSLDSSSTDSSRPSSSLDSSSTDSSRPSSTHSGSSHSGSSRSGSGRSGSSRYGSSRSGSSRSGSSRSGSSRSSGSRSGSSRSGSSRSSGSRSGSSRSGSSRSGSSRSGSSRSGSSRSGSSRSGSSRYGSSRSSRSRYGSRSRHGSKRRRSRFRRILRKIYTWLPLILLIAAIAAVIVIVSVVVSHHRGRVELELIGEPVVTIEAGEPYEDAGAVATKRKDDISDEIYEYDDVDVSKPGTYEVTYYVDEGRKTYEVTREVDVVDNTAPEIVLNGDEVIALDDFDSFDDPGVIATDDIDGDITESITVSEVQETDGSRTITYTAEDHSGNETTVTRKLVPYDDTYPEITLNGDETLVIEANQPFDDPGVTVIDNYDGDISDTVEVDGWVDVYRPDTYNLTYTATDSSGNQVSVSRTVVVESVPSTDPGSIYLTFDDGPSVEVTTRILDILDANNIKATFFIINYDEDELPIIERMIEEGHTVGIHSYTHDYSLVYSSIEAFQTDIDTLWTKLYDDTGYEAFVMRFPGGSSNTYSEDYSPGIMSELVKLVSEEGWMYMDWNVSGADAEGAVLPAEQIYENVIQDLDIDRKNVVLLHDLMTQSTTADALQSIIDYGIDNGYTFKAIQPDTVPVHNPVYN